MQQQLERQLQRQQVLQEQLQQQVQVQQREPGQVQELLLFCHRQPEQQQRSQRSEREIYSFEIPDKKNSGMCFMETHKTKPTQQVLGKLGDKL